MSKPAPVPSDAILTVPNLLTLIRLALVPVFVWLAIGPKRLGWAFGIGFVAAATDFIDGRVARRYGQVTKLGSAMDPFVDRLLIAGAAVILIVRHFVPLWTVIVVLARDALVVGAIPFIASKGVPRPQVTMTGKWATTGVMWGFGLFLGSHLTTPRQPAMWAIAWICFVPGVILSYVAAGQYAVIARRGLRSAHSQRPSG